jgi:hypothetical protein
MGVPRTYLFTPPEGVDDPYGVGMHHVDFIKKLKLCNKRITVPTPDQWDIYYPGEEMGITTVWLGSPPPGKGQKIAGMTMGWVPEWTVLTTDGNIKQKGWRAILRKCITARAFTQVKAEVVFKVSLDHGKSNLCRQCSSEGFRKLSRSASGMCDLHDAIMKTVLAAIERQKEQEWLSSPSQKTRRKANSSRVILDSLLSASRRMGAARRATAKSSLKDRQPNPSA